jgi:hypothetical protein
MTAKADRKTLSGRAAFSAEAGIFRYSVISPMWPHGASSSQIGISGGNAAKKQESRQKNFERRLTGAENAPPQAAVPGWAANERQRYE